MMGKLTGLCVLLLVLNVAVTEDTVTPVYFTDGGDLTLKVRPPLPDHINIIVWLFNDNLLAEWVEDKSYNLRLKGRANLTTETGQLIINKMSKEDEGVYSVEINNRVQSERYQAKLIKKVQKPKVWLRPLICGADFESCGFSCDSDTTEAEPITYSWKKGDGEWEVSGKDITITSTDDSGMKTFTCRMENPVSREESDPEHNPLYKEPYSANCGIFFAGLLVLSGVGAGVIVAWENMKGSLKNRGNNITDPAHGNEQPTSPIYETIPLQDNP
ncbi:SLAM family member 9-like isoform X2 [Sebastes umbrosus]|uniref:SLAM family member 9-like isoform X2 n=1 Tax=Sebastes umbrosus TaxID=72105 RepID=UPI00189E0384|nr:SLAM family member 9-like isoform X2 [Sebastes umbrosus]